MYTSRNYTRYSLCVVTVSVRKSIGKEGIDGPAVEGNEPIKKVPPPRPPPPSLPRAHLSPSTQPLLTAEDGANEEEEEEGEGVKGEYSGVWSVYIYTLCSVALTIFKLSSSVKNTRRYL